MHLLLHNPEYTGGLTFEQYCEENSREKGELAKEVKAIRRMVDTQYAEREKLKLSLDEQGFLKEVVQVLQEHGGIESLEKVLSQE